jgi:YVTN family beta-propeller protein
VTITADDERAARSERRRAHAVARRRRLYFVRRLIWGGALTVLAGVVIGLALSGGGHTRPADAHQSGKAVGERQSAQVSQLDTTAPYALSSPVERALAFSVGGRIIVAGGLSRGHSASGVFALDPRSGRLVLLGSMAQAFHDAAGAVLRGRLFVFGGGPETGTDTVQSFDLSSRVVRVVSHLPRALSDLSAAVVGRTVYLVGGFDGVSPQRTIYATTDGRRFRTVAALPVGLRYAAVTSAGGVVVVAGGTSSGGDVSSVYRFDPVARKVTRIGQLSAPISHAAAFALGSEAVIAGGRGASGAAVSAVSAIDVRTGRVRHLAALPGPVADAAVATVADATFLVGGWNGHTVADVMRASRAAPAPAASAQAATQRSAGATQRANRTDIYAATSAGAFSPAVRGVPERVYVPNSRSQSVDVINPKTFKIIRHFRVGVYPQHITPSWDLKHLYVNNTASNSLTVINPRTGRPTGTIPVQDPYNLYFTPDGTTAIVVAETVQRLDLRDPHTWALKASIPIPAAGPNHLDFSADGGYLLISNEFDGTIVKVDLRLRESTGKLLVGGSPVDVKLSPDGSVFFVANQGLGGVSVIDPQQMRQIKFIHTGAGAHGMAISRDATRIYVSNRLGHSISVLDPARRALLTTWHVGGSPDMIQISPDGKQLWVSNRFNREISVVDTTTGNVIHKISVSGSPHGLAYFPQPGRYSLGHNGVYR